MAGLEFRTLKPDMLLTKFAQSYSDQDFIANTLFPNQTVDNQAGIYHEYDIANREKARVQDDKLTEGAQSKEITYAKEDKTFTCIGRGLGTFVSNEIKAASIGTALNPEQRSTNLIMENLLLQKELRTLTVLDAALSGGGFTSAPAGGLWDSTGTPLVDFHTAIESIEDETNQTPNVAVMDSRVFRVLQEHDDIKGALIAGGTNPSPAHVSQAAMAIILGVGRVVVTNVQKNTAKKGKAKNMSRIYGNNVYLAFASPNASEVTPALGVTFSWKAMSGANGGFLLTKDFSNLRRGLRIEATSYYVPHVTFAGAGYSLTGVIS